MRTRFNIIDDVDLYEVRLNGLIIETIVKYIDGKFRVVMEYKDLPRNVQDQILDRVAQLLPD